MASVFCACDAHDDLALEHGAALVVEHRLEDLAAGAIAGHVVGDQGRIGVLAAPQQARAADAGDGAFAVEAHEQLVAHHRAAGGEQELVEARMRADRRHQARDVQRAGARAGDLDMVDMGLVPDLEFERGVDLIVVAGRAFVALDQHGARALLDDDERAGKDRGRRLAGIDEDEMDAGAPARRPARPGSPRRRP